MTEAPLGATARAAEIVLYAPSLSARGSSSPFAAWGATVRGTNSTPEAGARTAYLQQCLPRAKLPCACGAYSTQAAGRTCQWCVQHADCRTHVSAKCAAFRGSTTYRPFASVSDDPCALARCGSAAAAAAATAAVVHCRRVSAAGGRSAHAAAGRSVTTSASKRISSPRGTRG